MAWTIVGISQSPVPKARCRTGGRVSRDQDSNAVELGAIELRGVTDHPVPDRSEFVSAPATIYVIDDDQRFVLSLSALGQSMGLAVCSFASGEAFFHQFDAEKRGCLILEARLPDMSGLEVQERLAAMPIAPPIIFAATETDVQTVVRAKRMGAVNFLLKPSVSETDLWESILAALECDTANRTAYQGRQSQLNALSRLTAPERQVLGLLLTGHTNRAIAASLSVSRRAAESRRARLMRKLGLNSLPDLVRFGIDVGLFPSEDGRPETQLA